MARKAQPTGGARGAATPSSGKSKEIAEKELKSAASTPGSGGASGQRAATPTKKKIFGGTSRRDLRLELMGEDTPGPGAYLPASTFAKAASSSSSSALNKKGKKAPATTSAFRSTSPQRIIARIVDSPGPGSASPNWTAIDKNITNGAPFLNAKGERFGKTTDWSATSTGDDVGPGAYETHKYATLAMDTAHAVAMGSKQNPGFGIASPQHHLPHEGAIEQDKDLPGPGKYETNKSELKNSSGHTSAFKLPTERKKMQIPENQRHLSKKAGGGKKVKGGKGGSDAVMHV